MTFTLRELVIDLIGAGLAVSAFHGLRYAGVPELAVPVSVLAALWRGKWSATTCRRDMP